MMEHTEGSKAVRRETCAWKAVAAWFGGLARVAFIAATTVAAVYITCWLLIGDLMDRRFLKYLITDKLLDKECRIVTSGNAAFLLDTRLGRVWSLEKMEKHGPAESSWVLLPVPIKRVPAAVSASEHSKIRDRYDVVSEPRNASWDDIECKERR